MRQADALTGLAGHTLADQRDPDRATLVVHADLGALADDSDGCHCEIEHGPVVAVETARRLGCDGRTQRTVPAWLSRILRKRDTTCRFPGCNRRGSLQAHHIVHWTRGGSTDMHNLVLLCPFHHHYLHERGWTVQRGSTNGDHDGKLTFRKPNGRPFGTGPPRLRTDRFTPTGRGTAYPGRRTLEPA